MDNAEIFGLTARLRRAFPRVADVLLLCDEAERLARSGQVQIPVSAAQKKGRTGPKRDRAAYMRSYRSRQRG